jgi:hypothetical protein
MIIRRINKMIITPLVLTVVGIVVIPAFTIGMYRA